MFRFTQNRRRALLRLSLSMCLHSGFPAGYFAGLLAVDTARPQARYPHSSLPPYSSSARGPAGKSGRCPITLITGREETALKAERLVSRPHLVSRQDYGVVICGLAVVMDRVRGARFLQPFKPRLRGEISTPYIGC